MPTNERRNKNAVRVNFSRKMYLIPCYKISSTSIWYTLPSHFTFIPRVGCDFRIRKSGNDRKVRSENKKQDVIGKLENKKK